MSRKPQKRRSFTATQKAEAVRKHLKDGVPVSQIAEQMKVQPTMIHSWINSVLAQAEHVFESPRSSKAQASKQDSQLQQLREKIEAKNEVIAELMEENIRSKKENGEL
ncbi:MAG: transposase [Planctomycetales bacterium]|nr:transposase [Planctomycetales bacterium]